MPDRTASPGGEAGRIALMLTLLFVVKITLQRRPIENLEAKVRQPVGKLADPTQP